VYRKWASALSPDGYVFQNQFFSEQFAQLVSGVKNQQFTAWIDPAFLEHT
jgi:hypothetical protein